MTLSRLRAAREERLNSGTLEFHFGEDGAIVRAYTPERHREVKGAYVPTPWECLYRDYARVHGMQMPLAGEVEWLLPEGRLPYWRGRLFGHTYEFQA